MRSSSPALLLALSAPLLCGVTGCGISPNSTPSPLPGVRITGSLHGGQPPVSGSRVYLMAASTSGYGSGSTSLLNPADAAGTDSTGSYVLSGSDGSFSITGDYSCTSTQQLYLLALGGNPGLPGNVDAPQIALLAPLGQCSAINSSTFVQLNEVSTVAMAYALAGFTSSPAQIAASSSTLAATGLANAFAMVGNLESQGQALAATPAGNGAVPQLEINTLANILAACVNTSSGASSSCSTLFSNAQSSGISGTTPTNTAQAAINIARNPGSVNVSNLYGLQSAYAAFQPALAAVPPDLSLAITYTASGMANPSTPSVDASGNVWVPNLSGPLVELSPLGAQLSPAGGLTGGGSPQGFGSAVDLNGNVWVTDNGGAVKYDSSGNYIGSYTGGNPTGEQFYQKIAIGGSDNVWVADTGSLGKYRNDGTALSPSTGWATGAYVTDVRVDSTGVIWISDKDGYLTSFNSSGTLTNQFADGSYGAAAPIALAIDASNHIWVADSNTSEISQFTNTGVQSVFSGGGTQAPYSIAIDGAGSAWVANLAGTVSGFSNSGAVLTPAAGYSIPANSDFVFTAADGSGNLWVSLLGAASVMQFVGLTVPVVTPITPSQLGVEP